MFPTAHRQFTLALRRLLKISHLEANAMVAAVMMMPRQGRWTACSMIATHGHHVDKTVMTSRLPSLLGIETFLCAAEVLNFRLASERLNVTVSAVSYRIQRLEQDLGFALFDRGRRRLRLTGEGAALLERLRPGVSLLHEATTQMRDKALRPVLRIAAPPLVHGWLLAKIGEFVAQHPNVSLELLSPGRRRAASVDVRIVPLTPAAQRSGAEALVPIRISPVCSPDFLADNPVAEPADILKLPLIDTVPNLKGWNAWFAVAGIEQEVPAAALVVDNQALIYPAVMEGNGFAIGMRSLVAEYIDRGLMIEPFDIDCEFGTPLAIDYNDNGNIRHARAFGAWLAGALQDATEAY